MTDEPIKSFPRFMQRFSANPVNVLATEITTITDVDGDTQHVHIEDVFNALLMYADPTTGREGTRDTPARAAKAWRYWCSGYEEDPAAVLKVFEDGSEGYDQMVTVKDIPVYSHCEHHLASIFGTATISYIPDGRVVGLSKLSRLVNVYAKRLQVQERLTVQIADALVEHLGPLGVGVTLRCRHMCMESRGICQQGHHTVTTALRGCIRDEPGARAEFMAVSAP
jgi:GTP cyclohydrolase I